MTWLEFDLQGRPFRYNKATGDYATWNPGCSGKGAWVAKKPYRLKGRPRIYGRQLSHWIVWLKYGRFPEGAEVVDHRNGDYMDNSWDNLRIVDMSTNSRNRSPMAGVEWHLIYPMKGLTKTTYRVIYPKEHHHIKISQTFKTHAEAISARDKVLAMYRGNYLVDDVAYSLPYKPYEVSPNVKEALLRPRRPLGGH